MKRSLPIPVPKKNAPQLSLRRGVLQMQQSFEVQTSVLRRSQSIFLRELAEIQKLRELIEATEASRLATAKVQRTGVSPLRPPLMSCVSDLTNQGRRRFVASTSLDS
jgi:hypothetical protein